MKLQGKTAIITGAAKGIGAAAARRFAAEGARIVLADKDEANGHEVAKAIVKEGGEAAFCLCDVGNEADVQAALDTAARTYGKLDIVVNNAGIYEFARIEESTEALYRRQFDINVLGPLLMSGAAAPHLNKGSSIINISSFVTRVFIAESAIYSGTKGAIDAITGVLSRELGPRGIRVNAVNPGLIETEGSHSAGAMNSDFQTWNEKQTPLGRIGQVQDVAPIVSFLASDDAGWITGEVILASGGMR